MFSLPLTVHVVIEPRRRPTEAGVCELNASPTQKPRAVLVLCALLTVSEAMALTSSVKANGILDAFKQLITALSDPDLPPPKSPLSLALPPTSL